MADYLTGSVVIAELGGSSRSVVQRVRAGNATAIVKRFTGDAGGFPREAAALSVLPESAPVPRLLEVIESPPTVVMSDEGSGPSVAGLLLGSSSAAAVEGLMSWAVAIARLHDVSVDLGEAFRDALSPRPVSAVADDLAETISSLAAYAADLGVAAPDGAWDELCDRLGVAARYRPREMVGLSVFAAGLRAALVRRWGEVALPYAPAF
jgi:hypothetical protein